MKALQTLEGLAIMALIAIGGYFIYQAISSASTFKLNTNDYLPDWLNGRWEAKDGGYTGAGAPSGYGREGGGLGGGGGEAF